jgi:hypothetical protein
MAATTRYTYKVTAEGDDADDLQQVLQNLRDAGSTVDYELVDAELAVD